jgi:8-oxo-dGTP pyrophosphatase MutT (NUDIX family)
MLDFGAEGHAVVPKDAATLVLLRDSAAGVEVFCVERNKDSAFMGGVIVFPGGKLDPTDRDPGWLAITTPPRAASFAPDDVTLRALAIAACRETLEEAAILPVLGARLTHADLLALRAQVTSGRDTLRSLLAQRGLRLDLGALYPLARWITPMAETRRYDTRFFAAAIESGQPGAHDERETTASFWATPVEVLRRFDAQALQLAPPTHRMLTLLVDFARAEDVAALSRRACLESICPKLVPHAGASGDTIALVLPGDRDHDVATPRVPGPSRYVLHGQRWLPEDAPRSKASALRDTP